MLKVFSKNQPPEHIKVIQDKTNQIFKEYHSEILQLNKNLKNMLGEIVPENIVKLKEYGYEKEMDLVLEMRGSYERFHKFLESELIKTKQIRKRVK